jgi:hypothetical protein
MRARKVSKRVEIILDIELENVDDSDMERRLIYDYLRELIDDDFLRILLVCSRRN